MRKLVLAVLLAFGCQAVDAIDLNDKAIPWRTLNADEPVKHARPMLVYFGAVWCPPCKALETQVFNQPEVQAALAAFDPVFIDGDSPDVDRWLTRFKAIGFPTVVAIAPDGVEVGRFVGSADKNDFIAFLAASGTNARPLAMLKRLESGKRLTQAEWSTLSELEVMDASLRDYDKYDGPAGLRDRRDRLTRAVAKLDTVTPPLPAVIDTRLRVKSLLLDAWTKAPATDLASRAALLDRLLSDPASLADVRRELLNYSEEILDYLYPEESAAKRAVARRYIVLLEEGVNASPDNPAVQIDMMMLQLSLLRLGSDDVEADKKKFADRAESYLKAAATPADRLGIAIVAARLMRYSGFEFRAEATLRQSIALAPDAFYLKQGLSYYATSRGDFEQAVQLSEAAFRGAIKNPRAFSWGVTWVDALIERDPSAVASIEGAADEVMQRANTFGSAFLGYDADLMTSFATSLGRWASAPERDAEAKTRLLAGFGKLCDSVKQDARQAAACATSLATLRSPPPRDDDDSDA